MMKLLCAVVVAALAVSGCGKSEAEKQAAKSAEELKKAAEAVQKAQEEGGDTSKGMADMAKAMQGMAAAVGGGGGKPVDPISTDALKGTLPQIPGWDAGEPRSERMTAPIAFSQVETEYKNGNSEIDVKVVDTGYAQMLIAPWAMFLASGYSRETNEGYEKATTVGGHPGFERWEKDAKRGELNVFVGKRFLVTIEGNDLPDTKVLHEIASKMDFGKIAALK